MLDSRFTLAPAYSVAAQERRALATWLVWFGGLIGLSGLVGLITLRGTPPWIVLAWLAYLAGLAAIVYRPRYGLYLTLGLSMAGDIMLTPWYPFTKNFSSSESIFYLSNALIISPAEVYIGATAAAWLGHCLIRREWRWRMGDLIIPTLVFSGFVTYGLAFGLLRGGNVNIGLWEARAIYYLPAMLILTSQLIERRRQIEMLIWWGVGGMVLDALSGVAYVQTALGWDIASVARIQDHAASIHINSLFVLFAAMLIFRVSWGRRLTLAALLPIFSIAYVANQRRAAFLTLGLALVLLVALLYIERRRLFWVIAPAFVVLSIGYLGVFWNSSGVLGMPASALKSIIGANADERDASSNYYRELENINIMHTISQAPLTGVGFGQKFLIVAPMPDISFFVWWEYIPHNSILWMWVKTGIGGFIAMNWLFLSAIFTGVRVTTRMPKGMLSAIMTTATLFIPIFCVFAYVDMAWSAQTMIYFGILLGLINIAEVVVAQDTQGLSRRWPWQPAPAPLPGLRP